MENKSRPHNDVMENIRETISLSEDKRRQLRLEHNLSKLTQGDIQILKNDEFIRGLVDLFVENTKAERDFKRKLLISLGEATISEDIAIRERTLAILSQAGEQFLQRSEKDGILLVVHGFCKWLEYEKEMLPGLVVVIKRMEELTSWLLKKSFWKEGEMVISLFHCIQDGRKEKGPAFRSLVSQTLDKFATKATLEHLTDGYLLGDSNQSLFRNVLLFFETRAAVYLFNRLVQSLSRKERMELLHLIPSFGSMVLPILEECLKNNPPWAVVRNVICILTEIGNDSCYTFIKQYFRHEDQRVQYETICCVIKLGGPEIKRRLIDGLGAVNDDLKIHIIQLLVEQVPTRDDGILVALNEFIENRSNFSSR